VEGGTGQAVLSGFKNRLGFGHGIRRMERKIGSGASTALSVAVPIWRRSGRREFRGMPFHRIDGRERDGENTGITEGRTGGGYLDNSLFTSWGKGKCPT